MINFSRAMRVAISLHVIEFPRKFAEHEMDVELTEKLMGGCRGYSIGHWKGINGWVARNSYSAKAPQCSGPKNNISNKATAFWILLIAVFQFHP
jgi:hypothetical protein